MELEKWQWAWIAGLFEGEGSIGFTNRSSTQIKIVMTDRDVLETVDRWYPSPNGLYRYDFAHKKTQWIWNVASRDKGREFLTQILPYMHSRRRARIVDALARLERNPGAKQNRTHCLRGHPLSGENLYVSRTTGGRSCLTCRRAYDLRRNERQKEERRLAREQRKKAE